MKNLTLQTDSQTAHWRRSVVLFRFLTAISFALFITACSSVNESSGGRYAMSKDTAPDDGIELDPDSIEDAVPIFEPRTSAGNKSPYTVLGETYTVMPESTGYTEVGKASWYGKKFHGYKTSNGETYDMYKMSAAHKSLPIPSYVRVTNLANGRSGIVRVNDRGPFHSERIMDLSYAAATKLGIVKTGTGTVRLEAIEPASSGYAASEASRDNLSRKNTRAVQPQQNTVREISSHEPERPQTAPVPAGHTYLQVGAFRNQDAALALRHKLTGLTGRPVNIDSLDGFYKVRIGPLEDVSDAHNVAELLVQSGYARPVTVYF
jgi:rare lipoprotein A